jgi:hypothetical protein
MSPHQSTAASTGAALRARVPRLAGAAVERARLTVVPPRALARSQAARTPFAVLVIALLAAGVVGLLMFNTHMQQTSFAATELQQRANALTAQQQRLALELDLLRDPQQVATKAQDLGMVAPATPAFLRLSDGEVLGEPTPASPNDVIAIGPAPAPKPEVLERRTIIVPAEPRDRASGEAPAGDGD